jgi:hypothetical protein
MSIQFKTVLEIEAEYDKRARLMIRGIREGRKDLASNYMDLVDLDAKLAKEGEP